jgi:hypothetical protein
MAYKFTSSGQYVVSWGGYGADTGAFNSPTRICVYESLIFICDYSNNRIQVFDLHGNYVSEIRHSSGFNELRGVCITEQSILVLSMHAIYVFDKDAEYQKTLLSWEDGAECASRICNSNTADRIFVFYNCSGRIACVDIATGTTIAQLKLGASAIINSVVTGYDNSLYLVKTSRILKYSYTF